MSSSGALKPFSRKAFPTLTHQIFRISIKLKFCLFVFHFILFYFTLFVFLFFKKLSGISIQLGGKNYRIKSITSICMFRESGFLTMVSFPDKRNNLLYLKEIVFIFPPIRCLRLMLFFHSSLPLAFLVLCPSFPPFLPPSLFPFLFSFLPLPTLKFLYR